MSRGSNSTLGQWRAIQVSAGRIFLGVSTIVFGVQQFSTRGTILGLQIQPAWAPMHIEIAYVLGAFLIVAGGCLLTENSNGRLAACLLGIVFFVSDVLVRGSKCALAFHDVGERSLIFEALALTAGYFLAAEALPSHGARAQRWQHAVWTTAEMSRILFAVSLWIFGADHIDAAKFVASLIPAWIPGHMFWTYFTAMGLIAAALSTLLRRWAMASSFLLGWMFFLWVVLLHVPRVIAHPSVNEWNSASVALAMAGCSWLLAASAVPQPSRVRVAPVQIRERGKGLKYATFLVCILCAGLAGWGAYVQAASVAVGGSGESMAAAFLSVANSIQTQVDVRGSHANGKANIYAAIALNHAESHVLHGENQGKDLQHVAVLLQLIQIGKLDANGVFAQRPNAGPVIGAAMRKGDA